MYIFLVQPGVYMFMESAKRGLHKGDKCRLVLPRLPHNEFDDRRCFSFTMHAFGSTMGRLSVLDETGFAVRRLSPDGTRQDWQTIHVPLLKTQQLVVVEAERNGSVGDILVDDFVVTYTDLHDDNCGSLFFLL